MGPSARGVPHSTVAASTTCMSPISAAVTPAHTSSMHRNSANDSSVRSCDSRHSEAGSRHRGVATVDSGRSYSVLDDGREATVPVRIHLEQAWARNDISCCKWASDSGAPEADRNQVGHVAVARCVAKVIREHERDDGASRGAVGFRGVRTSTPTLLHHIKVELCPEVLAGNEAHAVQAPVAHARQENLRATFGEQGHSQPAATKGRAG